jgi:hypothetical protein
VIRIADKLPKSLFAVLITALMMAGVFLVKLRNGESSNDLRVQLGALPSSLDPLSYDYFENHPFQSLIHTRLTSMYRGNGIASPQLAERWSVNSTSTEWRFNIRKDVYFSGGKRVDANAVTASLTRICYLLAQSKSKNIFVNSIVGINSLSSANGKLPGLLAEGDQLVVRLDKPVTNVPEVVSFGLFSIAHQENFDAKTGKWLPETFDKVSGAGPYKFVHKTDNSILLDIKNEYPAELRSEMAPKKIHFFVKTESSPVPNLFFGPSDLDGIDREKFVFHGRGSRSIMYAQFVPWRVKSSPFSNPAIREFVKDIFLRELKMVGFETTNSFFPLVMPGIAEPGDSNPVDINAEKVKGMKIRFADPRPTRSLKIEKMASAFELAVKKAGMIPVAVKNFSYEQVYEVSSEKEDAYSADIAFLGTGISISDPISDIRLMFSAEGVNLPDVDGSVAKILENPSFDPQSVNQKIADQSVVIPLSRYDLGMWASPEIDLSDYNTLKSPAELQWIGVK